ncbi:MAG: sensor histidine kinase [Thiobacillus sp.]
MKFEGSDFYAALIHELKNNLGLLSMTIDSIPTQGDPTQDEPIDSARLQCQEVVDRLQQALLIYKASNQPIRPNIDAYSPHDLLNMIKERAVSLSRGRLQVQVDIALDTPEIWFFDRDLIEMALINAIHNSLSHAHMGIEIKAELIEGCLALIVRDDSAGYPEHILASVEKNLPCRASGTGLGLQFSRLIAQSHQNQGRTGELRLHNDAGAVFCLLLP